MPRVLVSSNRWSVAATIGVLDNLKNSIANHPDIQTKKNFPDSFCDLFPEPTFVGATPHSDVCWRHPAPEGDWFTRLRERAQPYIAEIEATKYE